MLRFERALTNDAKTLAEVSKRAFNNDIRYGAHGEGGPPGYDSHEGQIFMMDHFMYYKIVSEDTIIGGFIVSEKGTGHYELVRIFIDPNFQNMGIGAKTLEFIWRTYPQARKWTLDTPAWNHRTQHFYEKMGFIKVGECGPGGAPGEGFLLYEKRMAEPSP